MKNEENARYLDALAKKKSADEFWDRAFASGDIERIKVAMTLCQTAEKSFLEEDARRRFRENIKPIEVDWESEENQAIERMRLEALKILEDGRST